MRRQRSGKAAAFQFYAGAGSSWFPLFDATDAVGKIFTIDSMRAIRPLLVKPTQPIGKALRSLRQLADAGPLYVLEGKLEQLGFDFVSYRLIDGTRQAFEKSLQLVRDGKAVFWDRWSLPRGVAERWEFFSHVAMDTLLGHRIETSTTVWGIRSPLYAKEGSYSRKEMSAALQVKKLRLWPEGEAEA